MAGTSFYERTPSNARADVPAGRQVAFERVRAQDAFLTAGNAALAHPDSVNGDGQKHGSPQKSVRGGTLLPGELAAGATAREARPSPAAHQISVFDRASVRLTDYKLFQRRPVQLRLVRGRIVSPSGVCATSLKWQRYRIGDSCSAP